MTAPSRLENINYLYLEEYMPECPVCFNQLSDTDTKCSVCGATVVHNDNSKETYPIRTTSKHSKAGPLEEALSKLPFTFDSKKLKKYSLILAIVFVFSFILTFFKPSNSINYLLYAKDDEIFFSTVSKNDPKKLTENYGKKYYNYDLGLYYRLSQNGKRVFYFDNGSNNLYYKNSSLKGEPVFIASNVSLYDIDKSGKTVTYIRDGGNLYQHSVEKTSDPIDTDVISFITSEGENTLLYTKYDNGVLNLYRYNGKNSEKIVDYLSQLSYVSEDLKTIYYTKKGYFFKQVIGKRPITIHKDIYNVIKVYDDGKAYFAVNNPDTHTSDLYFYNGKKSELVFSGYGSYSDTATDKPVIAFYATSGDGQKLYTAVGSKAAEVNGISSDNIYVDPTGKCVYYITDIDPVSFTGTLYKAKISPKGLSSSKKIETNVYNGKFVDGGKFLFIKNYNQNTYSGEVYLNDKKIGDNISWAHMTYIEKKGSFVFFEYSSELYGNMIYYNGKRVKRIDENILLTNYSITTKGDVVYLKNYSEDFLVGDMYIFNGSRSKEVDVGVTHVSKTYDKTDFNRYLKGSLVS